MPARDIVDEICKPLWYRSFRTICEEFLQPVAGLADIEGMPDRLLADAVHHRRAGRFHGGDGGQVVGQFALQRPWHHDGQVGLHQEVIDGLGQRPSHHADRGGRGSSWL
ncbi:Uncharacterised protein [Mycobacterium tuberculosis]|uniref:Uncharacterized protein n=1 Tax=Mycobacterium tuberculosis TaxID=1773 RepID=A0A655FX27_MYCTX|nr:Uncharacterised protein [Mycobacterium tuberculosis]CFS03433.1 Uncharacterised protein [Mycobacterium tuberculosis]CKQ01185.1 Uncharacterised protein [Mycobacterium tuberculosis]CKR77947.1 Uncharacterised protein [Mycobacterium tuberculosis]CNW27125.1 Uncharacterised protein [Mycobacterium tuberculosis]